MKYLFIGLLLQCFALDVLAVTFTSRIHSIDKGPGTQDDLIRMENGRTMFLPAKLKAGHSLEELRRKKQMLQVTLDEELNLISLSLVDAEAENDSRVELSPQEKAQGYQPSIVSYTQAKTAFSKMRRDYQNDSQCYNRAHVWTYEEFQRTRMKTGKLFLFFTSRYIRNYRYKWWFHVAPLAYVGGLTQSKWRTLDRRYTSGLLTTKTWTDIFMKNNATCPVVSRYSAYWNHQNTRDCYLIPTSMYYWQPRDIEGFERNGFEKTSYINWEVEHSYWEAF